jgi:glc operon protein GlcG
MRKRVLSLLLSGVLLSSASVASAQMIVYKPSISSAAAKIMGEACEAFAAENGWHASVWVVDSAGHSIYMHRMQGAPWLSVEPSHMKAMTALQTGRPNSGEAAGAEQRGPYAGPNVAILLGLFMAGGGVPVLVDDQIAGAIGVGGTPGHDEECANIGIAAAMDR